jgi:hypothetical protein
MSIPFHKELFNNGKVRLMANFSNIKDSVADEDIKLRFYAINDQAVPIFTEELDVNEIRNLYKHLDSISVIKDGATKSSKLIETTDEINLLLDQLKESDLETILQLLEKFESQEKIIGLLDSLSELEIENLHGAYHHKLITEEIAILEELIELELGGSITTDIKSKDHLLKYTAGQPEKIFQNWIESNLWVFGVEYVKQHDARKIALFSEGDLLMESVDGYLDLIELKRPKHTLLKYDNSHKCYYPHPDLSKVIGQSLFYLQKLAEYKLNLEREYEVKVIMPRIKVIIGNNVSFGEEEKDCFRMLNSNLNSIQLITYNDLVNFGKLILATYEEKPVDNT